jgi:heme exporter protein D
LSGAAPAARGDLPRGVTSPPNLAISLPRRRAGAVIEFFAMGGYAAYVWPAFGFAGAALVGLGWQSWRTARRREAELEQLRRVVRPGVASRPRPRPAAPQAPRRAPEIGPPAVSGDASA